MSFPDSVLLELDLSDAEEAAYILGCHKPDPVATRVSAALYLEVAKAHRAAERADTKGTRT